MKGVFVVNKLEVAIYLKNGEVIKGYWRVDVSDTEYYVNENRIEIHKNADSVIGIPIANVSYYEVERVKEYLT